MKLVLILIFLTSCASLPGWNKEQPTISRYPIKADRMFSFVDDLIVIRYASLRHLDIAFAELGSKKPFLRFGETGIVKGEYRPITNAILFVDGDINTCKHEFNEHATNPKDNGKWDNSHLNINEVCFKRRLP